MIGLASIAPRLAKLIPLLSSDKAGEVTATAAAIDRALKDAGIDWHDLAERVASTPAPYVYSSTPRSPQPESRPQPTSKPKREPSPWPTFRVLKHSERVAWLHAIQDSPLAMERSTRHAFTDLKSKIIGRPHELLTREETVLFNRLVRVTWGFGGRI